MVRLNARAPERFVAIPLDRIRSAIPLFGTYQCKEEARGLFEPGSNSFLYSISRIFKPSCRLSDSRRDSRARSPSPVNSQASQPLPPAEGARRLVPPVSTMDRAHPSP